MSTLVNLLRIDKTSENICLEVGDIVLGRGSLLKCSNKKVSRNHALLRVSSDGKLELIAKHVSPCLYKRNGESNFVELEKEEFVNLNHGDEFSLLPDAYVYRVEISKNACEEKKHTGEKEELQTAENVEENISLSAEDFSKDNSLGLSDRKRSLPAWLMEKSNENGKTNNMALKKLKQHAPRKAPSTTIHKNTTIDEMESEMESAIDSATQHEENENETVKVKLKCDLEKEVKNADSGLKVQTSESSNSGGKIDKRDTKKRKPCWYGKSCYRMNPLHRKEFSHPDDSDFESVAEEDSENTEETDDRPECEYGITCFRKNPQHRKDFKHTQTQRKQKRSRKKKEQEKDGYSEEEDYDYDDPFLNDDTSDDYVPTDEMSDSSTDVGDMEDEDMKRTLKEAKKFGHKNK